MCIVSMVTDHYQRRWPRPDEWKRPDYDHFQDLIKKAKELDKETGQPDCPSDEKAEFLKKLAEIFDGYEIKKKS